MEAVSDSKTNTAGPVRVLSSRWSDGRAHDMDRFLELDGYASLDLALSEDPEAAHEAPGDAGPGPEPGDRS